jgi:ferredoxin
MDIRRARADTVELPLEQVAWISTPGPDRDGDEVRISVDNEVCQAHGQCNAVDPDLFTLDDDGYSNIGTDKDVPPGREVAAEQGVDSCPVQALRMDN